MTVYISRSSFLYFPDRFVEPGRLSKGYDIVREQATKNSHVSHWDTAQSIEHIIDVQV